ncbi:hypothetical protein HMPREF0293_2689 [Corynebacterium glucuronolyticum ATCC 51866]|uniref:Uncharacterized protein n=1 Tax=Corynebacterium glucuronolyticum ATCC 51866 TaxID=548478 RepID=A0ABP2DQI5_9CORY|nr:hypothetical protein HMPREF0293_2689 [Corynebacterium glucuronolyticum ATCC 51866]
MNSLRKISTGHDSRLPFPRPNKPGIRVSTQTGSAPCPEFQVCVSTKTNYQKNSSSIK